MRSFKCELTRRYSLLIQHTQNFRDQSLQIGFTEPATSLKFIVTVSSHIWAELTLTRTQVNGQTSVLMERGGAIYVLLAMDVSPHGIGQIMWGHETGKARGNLTFVAGV